MSDGIDVWWAAAADARPWQVGMLEPVDQQRHRALRRPMDRLRFVTGAALSRLAVARRLGRPPAELRVERRCERCGGPHGRPRFTAPGGAAACPSFSVSHSGDVVVVAVAGARSVGVDVEQVGAGALPPAAYITDDPLCVADEELLRLWVGKEAALKATGEGITVPMPELDLPGGTGRAQRRHGEGPVVHVSALPAPAGYLGALALVGARPRGVRHRDGSALLAGAAPAGRR